MHRVSGLTRKSLVLMLLNSYVLPAMSPIMLPNIIGGVFDYFITRVAKLRKISETRATPFYVLEHIRGHVRS